MGMEPATIAVRSSTPFTVPRPRKRTADKIKMRRKIDLSLRSCSFYIVFVSILVLTETRTVYGEHVRNLEVSEGAPIGTRVGYIGDGTSSSITDSGPPYLIVPVPGSAVDSDLSVDQTTGEIRTRVQLDRETRASYSLVAIPLSGDNVRVTVTVLDENDNAPTFPTTSMRIEFPENTPRDVKRTLHPARDLDLGVYNTQRYNIVSGNVDDAFRLSSHRERDGVLYLDLQINGFLDRETRDAYSLVIEALDGGTPPLRGEMTVDIVIQDVNDNQPVFNQSRYFATVPENATVGTSVLRVSATDSDAGDNGRVEYSINRRQSDRDNMFRVDASTGLIVVNRPLDFETKRLHELVIVARDCGAQPLETTAFVSIRVTDVNDNRPTINVIFLSDDATPKISESAQPGDFVARISVDDPDSPRTANGERVPTNISVELLGGGGHFGLTNRDNAIFLMVVALPLDREAQPNYTLSVVATDTGTPPLRATRTIHLRVTDVNDNAPEFETRVYHASVAEASDPGTSVAKVSAIDRDEGNNSAITYSLLETPDTHSASWFAIDSRTGLVTTRARVDCETDPVPRLIIAATDNGKPPLSSTATLLVTIHDVNDNEPIFDQSFYNVSVAENERNGRCVLKVSATDPDCGVNAMVNYTLGEGFGRLREFEVRSATGEVCITAPLDYETRNSYEFPIIATDRGGLSTTAMVKIQLTDVNDNRPIFYPREYNVSLREGAVGENGRGSVVIVAATDADGTRFASPTYRIVSGNDAGVFRIDRATGEIFVERPNLLSTRNQQYHHLNISATDAGGLRAENDAEVFISVIDAAQRPPIFDKTKYTYSVKEDVNVGTVLGNVRATSVDIGSEVRYSIYSGDPDGLFTIDTATGELRTRAPLDHERRSSALLNVQATSGVPPAYGHAQVNIIIEDVNDNPPEFESNTVRISVPENAELGTALYAAHARDRDSLPKNGVVRYHIISGATSNLPRTSSSSVSTNMSIGGLFAIESRLGHLTLLRPLDYETAQRHSLIVAATDLGEPPLSANLTVHVDVQDVNDNAPVFERAEYPVKVLESMPINSQILQVTAVDLDTGNNARLTYRLIAGTASNSSTTNKNMKSGITPVPQKTNDQFSIDTSELFGIFPNSGWLYLKDNLDRETCDRYDLIVAATDNGTPSLTATTRVVVIVLDANDNDPKFLREAYEFSIEENMRRGSHVGTIQATDIDVGMNALVRYSLIPSNASFQVNPVTGEIVSREPLDREAKESYELIAEARDQGSPSPRSTRVAVRITVTDINDNAPQLVDPREDVVSVREAQPPGTEVVRVRAVDSDAGVNASITYSIVKGSRGGNDANSGHTVFTIDPITGVVKTKIPLDHEEHSVYLLTVAATDGGTPPSQTFRVLRVEVLDLNDNRPTFSSSSLVFRVRENVPVGFNVGSIVTTTPLNQPQSSLDLENLIPGSSSATGSHITYTLTSLVSDEIDNAFDIDRNTGSLIVTRELDREVQSEYRLEVRALDTSASNNPQSSAVTVRVDIDDVNDNAPKWPNDPIIIPISENIPVGSQVYNFTATDADAGSNSELRYKLISQFPNKSEVFTVDSLTGTLTVVSALDFEVLPEYTLVVRAFDQSSNITERLHTSVTARIIVKDSNDNAPRFVLPTVKTVLISDSVTVGMTLCHILAVDDDSGENGRVTYMISSGNENSKFTLDYETGAMALAKPLMEIQNEGRNGFILNITASDHGVPVMYTSATLKLLIQDSKLNPPRFVHGVYHANVSEDVPAGSFVIKLMARSSLPDGGNLTYQIPTGVVDDVFTIDRRSGVIITRGPLDRETRDQYTIPVYVMDTGSLGKRGNSEPDTDSSIQFDVATLIVAVADVNDHAPEFKPGACYALSVPENSEPSVIHTIVAIDQDVGSNGDITYSIIAGNANNAFSLDSRTGELRTARPLDRETRSRYILTIRARDSGTPQQRHAACNITVFVEDRNDNAPVFSSSRYAAIVAEDAPADSSVVTVRATDADERANARLLYTLANETNAMFRIDNRSGVITTTGPFDRERKSSYEFVVVATDGGKYNAQSQQVPVRVTISDVNDNGPIFSEYPFRRRIAAYTQPGQTLVKVTATDLDEGTNSDIFYSLINEEYDSKYRINPNTGVLTASRSLTSESGKIVRLEVLARDKGNPTQTAIGLVELYIGDIPENAPSLRFQNSNYSVSLTENAENGHEVIRVTAVRTDGRRQNIIYKIGAGNEMDLFEIDSKNGILQVKNSKKLDYETHPQTKLIVEAKTDGLPVLYGYCDVLINLMDENDNAPRFTQQQYNAFVWEGKSKGTFVINVKAFDADSGANSRVLYHIVDGNHDNAFVIEPAFSGSVKTNIVLDREIRDIYRLTVIATDEGVPQMTGTATIGINIIDVNDNRPTFPPHSIITVSEATEVGTVLTAVTANDVDTQPALTYSLKANADEETAKTFTIDRFSGKVVLSRKLDFETRREHTLQVIASDSAHTAQTTLTIRVTDINDNPPVFLQPAYYATLPESEPNSKIDILTVNATDADNDKNSLIRYSFLKPVKGFSIDESSGEILFNYSYINAVNIREIELMVVATDSGEPALSSVAPVRINVNHAVRSRLNLAKNNIRVHLPENAQLGTTVAHLNNLDSNRDSFHINMHIADGDEDQLFEYSDSSNAIILIKPLDRETQDTYILHLSTGDKSRSKHHDTNLTSFVVHITIDDINDNAPIFQETNYSVTIREDTSVDTSVIHITAMDADLSGTPNSEIVYDITSGNDLGLFDIDPQSGVIRVNQTLDYDTGISEYTLILKACDRGDDPLCTITSVKIILEDYNDNIPRFPVTEYLEFIGENEPIGSTIFTARATDSDKGKYGVLNYSISSAAMQGYTDLDETRKLFKIDPLSGTVTSNAVFDYEQKNRYVFSLKATDIGGKTASVRVRVEIESRDEFYPQFTERTYHFILASPTSGNLETGHVVGHVTATDRDKGPDGRIVYQFTTQNKYFKINRTTGAIVVKKKLSSELDSGNDMSFIVSASSGRQSSLSNVSVVEITLDPYADPGTNLASVNSNSTTVTATGGGLADWALGLLIALVVIILALGAVFLFLHVRGKRHKKVNKATLSSEPAAGTNNYVDPGAFDAIAIRSGGGVSGVVVPNSSGQFAPPKYDEIPPYGVPHPASSNSGAATTSELSGSEQSGSSGRGSAEDDGEDEEIRMINEGPLRQDAGVRRDDDDDEDNVSDVSVRNTQEYLARLGIVDNSAQNTNVRHRPDPLGPTAATKDALLRRQIPMDALRMFDEESAADPDLTNLIYAKLNDVGNDGATGSDGDGGGVDLGAAVDRVMMTAFDDVEDVANATHEPSMNGSLSSIVHSEEELTGSYNWDYLLDWGPQYQPLAHVFSEIARLKDDTASVQSANSGNSSVKSKNSSVPHPGASKNIVPPPLLTNVAPRAIPMPVLSSRGTIGHRVGSSDAHGQIMLLPRSPISHDATTGTGFSTSTAMSPSFSPSLSPLATKSPSVSPLVTPGMPNAQHMVSLQRRQPQSRNKTTVDAELRI